MLTVRELTMIYVYSEPVDMRKSINGLSAYIVDEFSHSLQSSHLYVFWNRAKTHVKILFWNTNGFVIHYKRLERSRFKIPRHLSREQVITNDQLNWLLAGLDFTLMHEFKHLNYSDCY